MEQGFAVVLVAGLTVFGLVFIATEADFSNEDPENELTMLDKSIGTVGDVTEDFRTVEIGSFSVGEGRGDIQAYRTDDATVSSGLILGNSLTFQYEASQPRDGNLTFRVIGREGSGSLYFDVNGKRIFEEPMTSDFSGSGTEIEIEQSDLGPGVNNFEIGSTKGGFLSSTTYTLEDIEVEINDRDYHERSENFQMYTHEFENFRGAELSFRIPVDSSVPEQPLEIRVNGNTVSEETRGQGEYTLDLDTENSELRPGQNNMRFMTSGQAFYQIENANIEVGYAVTSDPESYSERFNLEDSDLDFVNREDTSEQIVFGYTNLNNPNDLRIDFNDETYNLTPRNGRNTVALDEGLFEEENILTLSSQGSFRIENLRVTSTVTEGE